MGQVDTHGFRGRGGKVGEREVITLRSWRLKGQRDSRGKDTWGAEVYLTEGLAATRQMRTQEKKGEVF